MPSSITFTTKGRLTRTKQFLNKSSELNFRKRMELYGRKGCKLLEEATPKRTGKTSQSWEYDVDYSPEGALRLTFRNTNMIGHTPIVKLLINGHLSKDGYWVEPNDFVSPTLQPLFLELARDIWREVRAK